MGAQTQEDRSTDDVERFLFNLRFESRGIVQELVTDIDTTLVALSR